MNISDIFNMEYVPESDELLGPRRLSPEFTSVKTNPMAFVVLECDTCGRKYAFSKDAGRIFRTCCEECAQIWDRFARLPRQRFKLYFYRVKLQDEMLKNLRIPPDPVEGVMQDYHPLDLILLDLLNQHGSMTRDEMVELVHLPRTTVYDSLKRLINMAKVKKYPLRNQERRRGRPCILFAVTRHVVKLTAGCKVCGNNKYYVDDETVQCIKCNAIWRYEK